MQKILFVVNPTSGSKPGRFQESLVAQFLDPHKFEFEVYETKCAGDGYMIVTNRLDDFDGFVAVGGDGTVNEVFKGVLGSDKWFSVIPNGSGNGLARTLDIPMDLSRAMFRLNEAKVHKIDYALINGEPFINVAGIGFDAKIASKFKESEKRGFKTYAEITMKEFQNMKSKKVTMQFKDKKIKTRMLLTSFANSSQFGNNAHIAPNAKLDDGKISIVTFKPFHWLTLPYLAWLLFNKAIDKSNLYKEYKVKKAVITTKKKIHLHVDGEARAKVKRIELEVVPKGVNVLA